LEFVPVELRADPLDETARSALAKSCYTTIDWKINETSPMEEAIKRMSANSIGALAVTSNNGDVVGVVSERDYLNKVGCLVKDPANITVGEVATMGKSNLVSVTLDNPIDKCMRKMIDSRNGSERILSAWCD
jgi:CBS domain-containing protein